MSLEALVLVGISYAVTVGLLLEYHLSARFKNKARLSRMDGRRLQREAAIKYHARRALAAPVFPIASAVYLVLWLHGILADLIADAS